MTRAKGRKLFIVVRKDLPPDTISSAQVAHAITAYSFKYPHDFKCWYEASNTIVVLQVEDLSALIKLCDRAWFEAVRRAEFSESDFAGVTAVAFEPSEKSRKFLKKLDLVRA